MLKQQNELQNYFHFLNYSNYNILNFYCNKHRHRRLNFSIRNHFFFIKNINTFKSKSIFFIVIVIKFDIIKFSERKKFRNFSRIERDVFVVD